MEFLLVISIFFLFSAIVGMFKFKDFFTKVHAASLADSIGAPLTIIFIAVIYGGDFIVILKLLLIAGLIFIFAPIASSRLAKAAYKDQEGLGDG